MQYREYIPESQLSRFVRYFWVFEKKPEEKLFERDVFFPDVDSIMVFQVKGAVSVDLDEGIRHSAGSVAVLAGAKKSIDAFFPDEHLLVGVTLKPGAATALRLFSPQEVHGLAALDVNRSTRVIEQCQNIPQEAELSSLLRPVKDYLYQHIKQRSEKLCRNQKSVTEGLPPFGSKLGSITGGLTLRQIERISRLDAGYTPQQYASLKACTTARKLIFTQTYSNFSDLALQLGFCDQPHFCKVFKKWFGMSPGEYDSRFAPFRSVMTGENRMFTYTTEKRFFLDVCQDCC